MLFSEKDRFELELSNTEGPSQGTEPIPTRRSRGPSLRMILAALILGVVVGTVLGRPLWEASGGPGKRAATVRSEMERVDDFLRNTPSLTTDQRQMLERYRQELQTELEKLLRLSTPSGGVQQHLLAFVAWIIELCGELYLRVLMLFVLPLVMTSIMSGTAALGRTGQLGRVTLGAFSYYLLTTAIAVGLGLFLVELIRPGSFGSGLATSEAMGLIHSSQARPTVGQAMNEIIRGQPGRPGTGLIPGNLFAAAAEMNILGLIFFALLAGLALAGLGGGAHYLLELIEQLNALLLRMVQWVIRLAPIGVFGLVAGHLVARGGGSAVLTELARLGYFAGTVLVGLLLHFALLNGLTWILGGVSPRRLLPAVAPALATAFATSSSSATLPVSLECSQQLGFSRPLARFILPLGATVNMDGTALYEAVAAVFLAQLAGIELGLAELLIVFVTATLAAIGAPGIPNAGLVTLLIVLTAVKVPAEGIGLILAIDWFLDRCRTVVNVFGDLVGLTVVGRYFPLTPEQEESAENLKELILAQHGEP